jgi:hypothetical protein
MATINQKYTFIKYIKDIEELNEWYNSQPKNNASHPDNNADYRDKILEERLDNNDPEYIYDFVGELEKIALDDKPFNKQELINKLNNL